MFRERPPQSVLARFGLGESCAWKRIGSGFSGAAVFAGSMAGRRVLALKGWPAGTSNENVEFAHRAQMQAADAANVVPKLIPTRSVRRTFAENGRFWELGEWKEGKPLEHWNELQLQNAMRCVAALHRGWSGSRTHLNTLQTRFVYVNNIINICDDIVDFGIADGLGRKLLPYLQPISTSFAIHDAQVTHGDLHREHVLFTGDAVSGLIDFAASKVDHPALDLARLLDGEQIDDAVTSYRGSGGAESVTPELVRRLDRAILLGSAATWLLRFARREVPADHQQAALSRLDRVAGRLRSARSDL